MNIISTPETKIKQVIIIRKDLKMRRGKEIAQAAHASMAFLSKNYGRKLTEVEQAWLDESFSKITLQIDSEKELLDIAFLATCKGINVDVITDSGKTEFHGIPTITCCALGPDYSEKIDNITGHLRLY